MENIRYMEEAVERIRLVLENKDYDNEYKIEVIDDVLEVLYGAVDLEEMEIDFPVSDDFEEPELDIEEVKPCIMKDFFVDVERIIDSENDNSVMDLSSGKILHSNQLSSSKKIELIKDYLSGMNEQLGIEEDC